MEMDDWTAVRLDSLLVAHPREWEVQVEQNEEGVSAFLQSPGVSFGVVGNYSRDNDPEDLVEQILDSVREEHPGLELEPMEVDERNFPQGVGVEGMFMTLDTVAYCWVRSWRSADRSVVVFLQCVERESADSEEIFHLICRSISTGNG